MKQHTFKQTGLLFLLALNTLLAKSLGPSYENCIFGNMPGSRFFPTVRRSYYGCWPVDEVSGLGVEALGQAMFGISYEEYWRIAGGALSYKRHHAVGRVLRLAFKYLFGRGDTQHA